ncbi:ATP-binding cassette domain-containing protein [Streptomyces sp. NPDC048275]|uniref:ATP-binding cassette domain-containing protein n=1 Tax=Streptomyces sp. NPDC048275 TaxID=3155629 RepID=UPI00340F0FCA
MQQPPAFIVTLRGGSVAMVAQNAGHALTPSLRIGRQIAEAGGEVPVVDLLEQVRLPALPNSPALGPVRSITAETRGGSDTSRSAAGAHLRRCRRLPTPPKFSASLEQGGPPSRRRPPPPCSCTHHTPLAGTDHRPLLSSTVIDRTGPTRTSSSGGQQQRVAIAMAIAACPKVLVLDEPTTGLDVVTQRGVLDLIGALRDELGLAAVLVSHDLGVVAHMADEVTVLRSGRVVESAPTRRLFAMSQDPYTERLLASVSRLDDIGLALVGESGSGKSTLAWTLAGLRTPSGGTTTHESGDLARPAQKRPPSLRRRVQLVFQNADTSLNPRRSVGDAVRRPLRFFGTAGTRTQASARARPGSSSPTYASTRPSTFARGQAQRYDAWHTQIRELSERGVTDGEFTSDDLGGFTVRFAALADGLALQRLRQAPR